MNSGLKIPKLRWVIASLLLLITMINYMDRMTLSVLVGDVRKELDLSETDYAHIVSIFFFAYAIMYAGSGYLVDRLGTKVGLTVFVCGWSIAQMLHGLAVGKWTLAGCRFFLGLTEPGNFPAAAKAIREWFPARQRAIGIGVFNAGSSLGAAIAAPVAAFLGLNYGWRAAFFFTGALGFVWLVFWVALYQKPERNRWLSQRERAELDNAGVTRQLDAPVAKGNWLKVLRSRPCLTLMLARFLSDPVIYFVIFWLPAYLQKERGFDLAMIGKYGWVPYIFGDIGYLLGGFISSWLIGRGWTLPRSRKIGLCVGAAMVPMAIFAPLAPSAGLAIAATCFIVLGHAVWIANLLTLPADIFESNEVATASGFSGMGGSIGGILANMLTGYVVSHFSYLPIFVWAGLMHPLALFVIWRLLPDHRFGAASVSAVRPGS